MPLIGGRHKCRHVLGGDNSAQKREEVDRYRTATDDALQQINRCIGYLAATKQGRIASSLSVDLEHIRSNLLGRAPQSVPTTDPEAGQESAWASPRVTRLATRLRPHPEPQFRRPAPCVVP